MRGRRRENHRDFAYTVGYPPQVSARGEHGTCSIPNDTRGGLDKVRTRGQRPRGETYARERREGRGYTPYVRRRDNKAQVIAKNKTKNRRCRNTRDRLHLE